MVNCDVGKKPDPPPSDDEDEEEWPSPPFAGFVPLDDRMEDRKHTRRMVELLWSEIQKRLQKPWTQE